MTNGRCGCSSISATAAKQTESADQHQRKRPRLRNNLHDARGVQTARIPEKPARQRRQSQRRKFAGDTCSAKEEKWLKLLPQCRHTKPLGNVKSNVPAKVASPNLAWPLTIWTVIVPFTFVLNAERVPDSTSTDCPVKVPPSTNPASVMLKVPIFILLLTTLIVESSTVAEVMPKLAGEPVRLCQARIIR